MVRFPPSQVPTREPDTVYCPVEFHEESLQFGAFKSAVNKTVKLKRQASVWSKSPEGSISVATNTAPRRSRGNFSQKESVLKPLTSRAGCVSGRILSPALKHHFYD